jgi:lysine 6-dehydrogenase
MKVILLGIGMQGSAALHDLARSRAVREIVAADRDLHGLRDRIARHGYGQQVRPRAIDAAASGTIDQVLAEGADVVIDLLPIRFIATVAAAAVRHGVHLVNTFYATSELQALAMDARERGISILPEFGMDPGIDLLLLGEAVRSLDAVTQIRSYGAGIPTPEAANNPLKYKVSWTLDGVLRSYLRPARIVREGCVVEIGDHELFHPENVHEVVVSGLGALEAYPNGDIVPNLEILGLDVTALQSAGRYTMRWPGHAAFWRTLVDVGLLDEDPVIVDGVPVSRRGFLARALESRLQYGDHEQDLGIVRVEVDGRRGGRRARAVFQAVDRRDPVTGLTAMSRLVGYTASVGAHLIGTGRIATRGLLSPLRDVPYDAVVRELGARDIHLSGSVKTLA